MTWLTDLSASIAAGEVRVVSDEEHRREWQARHWKQRQQDLRRAQSAALQYSADELSRMLDLLERSCSPYVDTVKRQYIMALEIKRRGKS